MIEQCHVYIIAHVESQTLVGPVKIGIAQEPTYRVLEIQTGNPRPLQVAAWFPLPSRSIARQVETAFHEVMVPHRLMGEWFDMDVLSAILAMCQNIRACITETLPPDLQEDALLLTGVADREDSAHRAIASKAN